MTDSTPPATPVPVPVAAAARAAGRRGQPPKLTAPRRARLLDDLAAGATLAAAAAAAGVTRATVHNTRCRDAGFDTAVTAALALGRATRLPPTPPKPGCPACAEPALEFTVDGVACTACATAFSLVPARRLPASGEIWRALSTPPLAQAS